MKIVFLGNFCVNYTTENDHLWTLKKLGHEVIALQEGKTTSEQVRSACLGADLFYWTHTHGWNTEGMKEVLAELKNKKIPSVGYHLDLWKGITREADVNSDPYWNIEYFFTVDKLFAEDLKKRGIKAYYLPPAVIERDCYRGVEDEKFKHDVIFVGSKGYHQEWPYRPQLINWLSENYKDKFAHYGGDGRGVVRGSSLNNLYRSSKVIIGDTLCKNFDYPYYFSDRLFETIGRGGFIIFPYIKGLEDLFVLNYPYNRKEDENKGVELVCYKFGDFQDLKNKIDFFLTMDSTRESIRQRAFDRVKKENTYTNRLSYLINILNR